jgi:hypothetical protein
MKSFVSVNVRMCYVTLKHAKCYVDVIVSARSAFEIVSLCLFLVSSPSPATAEEPLSNSLKQLQSLPRVQWTTASLPVTDGRSSRTLYLRLVE